MTGLGISGIAVALAVQSILGDLFASFSIVMDQPIVIGDTIIIDENIGTVEYIGLKSTRVRSINGEQLPRLPWDVNGLGVGGHRED